MTDTSNNPEPANSQHDADTDAVVDAAAGSEHPTPAAEQPATPETPAAQPTAQQPTAQQWR